MQKLEAQSDVAKDDRFAIRAEIEGIQVELDIMPDKLDIDAVKAMIAKEAATMQSQLETSLDQSKGMTAMLAGLRSTCDNVAKVTDVLIENRVNVNKALILTSENENILAGTDAKDSELSADKRLAVSAWERVLEQLDHASKLYCPHCVSSLVLSPALHGSDTDKAESRRGSVPNFAYQQTPSTNLSSRWSYLWPTNENTKVLGNTPEGYETEAEVPSLGALKICDLAGGEALA